MKGFFRAPWRFAACYAAFLIAAFTWALLDTFVIPHRELIVSRARDMAEEVLETLAPSAVTVPPATWRTYGWPAPPFCARRWPKTPSAAT